MPWLTKCTPPCFSTPCSSKDAEYAWRKMDGLTMDGRKWKVDWANKSDFKFFDWKWTEGDDYSSPAPKDTRDGDAYSRSP